MDYKKDLEELEKRIDENANRIISNFEKINTNADKIDSNADKIQRNSYALDILRDYKSETKRLYTILIIVLCMWFITIGIIIFGKLL